MKFDRRKTIVFLGDSVTEGCFALYPTDYGFDTFREPEKCFVTKVKNALTVKYGEENVNVINAGVSGDTTMKALLRFERDVMQYSPDVVVTATGLNDIFRDMNTYAECYRELAERVKGSGAKHIVMTPNMLNTYVHPETLPCSLKVASSTVEKQKDGTLDSIVEIQRKTATEFGAALCDVYLFWKKLYSSGVDTTALLANYINHPCEEMHGEAARLVLDVIESL